MKLRSVMTSALGVAVLTQFAAPASAISLINETFGSGNADQFNTTGSVGAFTVTSGNIDLIGDGGIYDFYPGNGNYIDLNGNTSGAITSSIFNFTAGETATLSFDYGQNGSGTADVFFGGNLIASLTAPGGSSFASFSTTLSNPTTGALSFVSTSGGAGGIVLDNVQFNSVAAVPEPSDLMGTAFAFGSVVMLKRKFGKNKTAAK